MTDKIYVILERSYEYNDETYDAQQGGNCVIGYNTEAEADKAWEALMIKSIKDGVTYMYYGYNSFLCNSSELVDVLNKYNFSYDNQDDYETVDDFFAAIKDAPDKDILVVVNHLIDPLFFVQELEMA